MALRPGQVRDAIIAVLKEHDDDGLKVSELYPEVNVEIGSEVPLSSVRSYLNINTPGLFERTGFGRYKLSKNAGV